MPKTQVPRAFRWVGALFLVIVLCPAVAGEPGAQWIQATRLPDWSARAGHAAVVFGGKMWLLGGYYGGGRMNDAWYSQDGVRWRQVDMPPTDRIWRARSGHAAVVFQNKIWVLGGYDGLERSNDIWRSKDGATWERVAPTGAMWSPRARHAAAVSSGRMWVLGGYDGGSLLNDVWSSKDGITWTQVVAKAPWTARHHHAVVAHADKLWLLGGDDVKGRKNDVWYSWDGGVWIKATEHAQWESRYLHTAVSFAGQLWVLGGHGQRARDDHNDVWYSANGSAWERADTKKSPKMWSPRNMHTSLVYKGRVWVIGGGGYAGGRKNDVWNSADGALWYEATRAADWSVRDRHASVAHDDKLWVLGGFGGSIQNNDVWWSGDAIEWTGVDTSASKPMWSPRYNHAGLSYDGKLWVIGGCDPDGLRNDVWSSPDGAVWEQAEANPRRRMFSPRQDHAAVVFMEKLWVLGGRDVSGLLNDVWISWDGSTWRRVTREAQWSPREEHAAVAFGDMLYVLGGDDRAGGRKNDVWCARDGLNWTQVDTSRSEELWSPRSSHAVLSAGNLIWVLGGYGQEGLKRDVWSSPNGRQWTLVNEAAPWAAREEHAAVFCQGRIYILGGFAGNLLNDVWYTRVPAQP